MLPAFVNSAIDFKKLISVSAPAGVEVTFRSKFLKWGNSKRKKIIIDKLIILW